MIIDIKGNEVFGTLSKKTGKSSISTEKMHKIIGLLSSQYSDPIGSMMREYTSNIHDSYIGTGKVPKGVVSLWKDSKTQQNYLSFIDNGSGMSPEMFEDIFIVYGESTKDHDNEAIGGFGLGSKTGFAYTDSFTIITRYEGKKYTYYYYKGKDGVPHYDLLSIQSDIEEENGTEIRIPVKAEDLHTIKNATKHLMYFDNIVLEGFDTDNDYKIYEGEYFKIRSNPQEFKHPSLHICLEKVYYPLPEEFISYLRSAYGVSIFGSEFRFPVALKFSNGELTPTISRENFEYNESVRDLIYDRFKKAMEELKTYFLKTNKEYFSKDDSILEFYEAKNSTPTLTFGGDDCKITINSKILGLNFKHELLENFPKYVPYTATSLISCFIIQNHLINNSIRSVNKTIYNLNTLRKDGVYFKDENIISRSDKTRYIREKFSNFSAVKVIKPSLKFYKDHILWKVPKENWREVIICYQKCIENIVKFLPKYSEIEVPDSFKEEKKTNSSRQGNTIKYELLNRRSYENKHNELSHIGFKREFKTFGVIYGTKKDKDVLQLLSDSVRPRYKCIIVRQKDLKFMDKSKKYINVKNMHKIENVKILRGIVKSYQLSLLRNKTTGLNQLSGINDKLFNTFKDITGELSATYSAYGAALYESHPEYRDLEVEGFLKKVNIYFKDIGLLNFAAHRNYSDWSSSFLLKKSIVDFLKLSGKEVNLEFYLKLNKKEKESIPNLITSGYYDVSRIMEDYKNNPESFENKGILTILKKLNKNQ